MPFDDAISQFAERTGIQLQPGDLFLEGERWYSSFGCKLRYEDVQGTPQLVLKPPSAWTIYGGAFFTAFVGYIVVGMGLSKALLRPDGLLTAVGVCISIVAGAIALGMRSAVLNEAAERSPVLVLGPDGMLQFENGSKAIPRADIICLLTLVGLPRGVFGRTGGNTELKLVVQNGDEHTNFVLKQFKGESITIFDPPASMFAKAVGIPYAHAEHSIGPNGFEITEQTS